LLCRGMAVEVTPRPQRAPECDESRRREPDILIYFERVPYCPSPDVVRVSASEAIHYATHGGPNVGPVMVDRVTAVTMAPSGKRPAAATDPADKRRRLDDGLTPSTSATPVRFPRVPRLR